LALDLGAAHTPADLDDSRARLAATLRARNWMIAALKLCLAMRR
jgi:hypothetical protein